MKIVAVRLTESRPLSSARTTNVPIATISASPVLTHERHLGAPGRVNRVEQQPELQLDEDPSHDSSSPSPARDPTRSMKACCRVLPPRTSAVVPVATIRPSLMIDT